MPAKRLKDYLEHEHIAYISIHHPPAFTAQEVAQSVHVPGREMAKSVILMVDGRMMMLVLPASQKVLLQDLKEQLETDDIRFATEEEFRQRFPDCETGAMPPFGNLYGIPVLAAPGAAFGGEIVFNAGSHEEVIRMRYRDFEQAVHPMHLSFTT